MDFVSARRDSRRFAAAVSVSIALAFAGVLAFAGRAQAAETLYWNNYGSGSGSFPNVSFASLDGSGGGELNSGLNAPEGLAYDSATNRLFVATGFGAERYILAINLDGSGASTFTAPGAPVEEPEGVVVDPATRTIYWENTAGNGSFVWAKLNGSAGGVLSTTGVTLNEACCRITIDPAAGRFYFVNNGRIDYANLNNTGGGELNLTGSTIEPGGEGLAVDAAAGRLYFLGDNSSGEGIGYANVNNSGGGDVPLGGAPMKSSWGLAFDPVLSRLYWGNEGNGEERTNAFGFVNLSGAGGGISIATAPVAYVEDPVIIKSPSGTGAPTITRDAANPAALTCSTGSWAPDSPGSFVYQAPRNYGYQWVQDGAPLADPTANMLIATQAGSYTCTVTATNQSGSTMQASGGVTVRAARVKLAVMPRKAKAKAGGVATFEVKALNQGDLQTGNTRICVEVSKKAKKALKTPKCKSLGSVVGATSKATKLKVKIKPSAVGIYQVKIQIKGSVGKAAKGKIVVR
jgi:DNA-binding beta-propeller fold protein YncE